MQTAKGAMGVKPELAFDVCWEVYRNVREVLESKRGVSARNWKDSEKFRWRPDIRPRLNDWMSDFTLAGQAALDGSEWASRMVMFRLHYLGLAPYETARHFLGLSEHNWVKLVGRDPAPLRKGTAASPYASGMAFEKSGIGPDIDIARKFAGFVE